MDEEEIKKEVMRMHLQSLKEIIVLKYNSILFIATIASAVLAIASFNSAIIPNTKFLKILMVIILLIIPTCLLDYLYKLNAAESGVLKELKVPDIEKDKKFLKRVFDGSYYFYGLIICLIFLAIIVLIIVNFNQNDSPLDDSAM